MSIRADKIQQDKPQVFANGPVQKKNVNSLASTFVNNRPEAIAQRKLQEDIDNSPQVQQRKVYQALADNYVTHKTVQRQEKTEEEPVQGKFEPVQKKVNNTGLPDNLKSGVEQLSGYAMDDVKVHYNSSQPAHLNALAYAQGTDIHIAPGQEKHLPHEAWHIAQQKQGRVTPTVRMKVGVAVNDDQGLENEADIMGAKAVQMKKSGSAHGKSCGCSSCSATQLKATNSFGNIIQKATSVKVDTKTNPLFSSDKVAQLTDASIFVNNTNRGNGHCDIGQGTGGVDHAEQLAWNNARASVNSRFADVAVTNVIVSFDVTQTICTLCQDWFETTVYNYLQTLSLANANKTFSLTVAVDDVNVHVHGVGETTWPEEVGDDPRLALVELLKAILIETGGIEEEKITVIDAAGEPTYYEYYGDDNLEEVLREHEDEIKATKEHWENFQETGMVLRGKRANLDFDDIENEKTEGLKRY